MFQRGRAGMVGLKGLKGWKGCSNILVLLGRLCLQQTVVVLVREYLLYGLSNTVVRILSLSPFNL